MRRFVFSVVVVYRNATAFCLIVSSIQDAIKYSIIGENPAPEYFYIDPDAGLITVKRLLTEGETSQYNVSRCDTSGYYSSNIYSE